MLMVRKIRLLNKRVKHLNFLLPYLNRLEMMLYHLRLSSSRKRRMKFSKEGDNLQAESRKASKRLPTLGYLVGANKPDLTEQERHNR